MTSSLDGMVLDHDVEIEIRSYKSIRKNTVESLRDGMAILVAEYRKFSQHVNILDANGGKPVSGRVMLLSTENDLKEGGLHQNIAIDYVDANASAELLQFKLARTIREVHLNQSYKTARIDVERTRNDLESLNEIGMALSTEKDLNRLLDMIVSRTRSMTYADAGSLYLIESDPNIQDDHRDYFTNKKMRFQVAQNDSRNVPFKSFLAQISKESIYGYVALTQEHLVFEDVYFIEKNLQYGWGGREFDAAINYRTKSMLTVPMINWKGETIGVIQLINRKTSPDILLDDPKKTEQFIQPFTNHDVRMALSIASQASIAIQNTQLVESIQTLFDGFIDASVQAIESRDPTTAGHSHRVAELTVGLAELIDRSDAPKFKEHKFTRENLQEVRYASLLHDFGKIGVREHVLVKAKKLYPHELRSVHDRFDLIQTLVTLNSTQKALKALEANSKAGNKEVIQATRHELEEELIRLKEMQDFILQCNEPTVLAQGGFERLIDLAKISFKKLTGDDFSLITPEELVSLSVPRGSLTEADRKEIESHVTHTYRFLKTIPWTSDLRNVPDYAYAHHEKLDGTGYPNGLDEGRIPIQAKMMTISDIFDALTASDRPYKKALPAERALNILMEESNNKHIDGDLLNIFIESEIYRSVL